MKTNKELISDINLHNMQTTLLLGACVRGTVFVNRYQVSTELWYSTDQNYPVVDITQACDKICPRCADPNVKSRRGYETCICIHAEMVSLLKDFTEASYMVVSRYPCMQCLIAIIHDSRIVELIIIISKDETVDQQLIDAMDVVISRANMDIRVIDIREGDERVSILRSTGKRQDDTIKTNDGKLRRNDIVISPILKIRSITPVQNLTNRADTIAIEIRTSSDSTEPRLNETFIGPISKSGNLHFEGSIFR